MDKVGRNDPCPCGSGKKFKKCCAMKTPIQKLADKITPAAPKMSIDMPGVSKLSGLFQQNVNETVTKEMSTPQNAPSLKDKVTKPGSVLPVEKPIIEPKDEEVDEKQT
ncbi:MAG: SEC-C domain-containing protein [Simkaniaceae bacterium]|nr:SEC-C domain-containing protein [Simkaniaceae bacterium]